MWSSCHQFLGADDTCCFRVWVSYLNPIFWTVYGLIESQVDNLSSLVTMNSGEMVPAYEAVEDIFGYQ